jgi:hypothetical protein
MIDEKRQSNGWNNQKLNPANKTLHITTQSIQLLYSHAKTGTAI